MLNTGHVLAFAAIVGLMAAFSPFASPAMDLTTARDGRFVRIFREPRVTRGDLNIRRVQPVDEASWIGFDGSAPAPLVTVFEREFEIGEGETGAFTVDVSADERFVLLLDGAFVARGPDRGIVENWLYQTYRVSLKPGRHVFRAIVKRLCEAAPLAQLTHVGGFVLKADGVFDERLTTGKAAWKAAACANVKPIGAGNGVWGTGEQFEISGSGPYDMEPREWRTAAVVRGPAGRTGAFVTGGRTKGWMLFPSQLPDQVTRPTRPGSFRAATHAAAFRGKHVYDAGETRARELEPFNRLLRQGGPEVTVPPGTSLQLVWDLGKYQTAYPEIRTSRGKGARISLCWAESMRDAKSGLKGLRSRVEGKFLDGYGDIFLPDGTDCTFSTPWFRAGLFCRMDIETGEEPLVLRDLRLVESRYPLEMEGAFSSPDDPTLAGVRDLCLRSQQMCTHDMFFDCPYYEQQMYPGDTRVQMLATGAITSDDRLIRRAIELFDFGTRDNGQCPFRWLTRATQEGFTYTLCYLTMYGDYTMNHADRAWLRARLPGLRKSMAGCELYENAAGLVENTPGWNFMDWAVGWERDGTVRGSRNGRDANAFVNLLYLLAMQSAITTERALGNELQARYWEEKSVRLKAAILGRFWCAERALVADTAAKSGFSEHAQALAIITGLLGEREREECFRHLIRDPDLSRATVYFSFYLFEAFFKMGRADLFLNRLDLWRGYSDLAVTTLLERPESDAVESRSDCHAWGSHPLWFMQTGLAGIRSAAPFFAEVLVAPQPGPLKAIHARAPHPSGFIDADLTFENGQATGTVSTPVGGRFSYRGQDVMLQPGLNRIR